MEEVNLLIAISKLLAVARHEAYMLAESNRELGENLDAFLCGAVDCIRQRLADADYPDPDMNYLIPNATALFTRADFAQLRGHA